MYSISCLGMLPTYLWHSEEIRYTLSHWKHHASLCVTITLMQAIFSHCDWSQSICSRLEMLCWLHLKITCVTVTNSSPVFHFIFQYCPESILPIEQSAKKCLTRSSIPTMNARDRRNLDIIYPNSVASIHNSTRY